LATGLTGKRIATVLLALFVLVPTSLSYAQNLEGKETKIQKFIELAERAMDKTETLINITYANTTAMDIITDAGFYDQFMDNVTLFDKAAQNVTNAQERLDVGDLEGAIANVTYALEVFRDVFKAIHFILCNSDLSKGELIDAQGLIQAMKRALERIDKLEEIGDLPDDALLLLEEARLYLNITAATEWLQLGLVNQTAHNLTDANKLIADAHKTLKNAAAEMNTNRIRAHLRVMTNFRERLGSQVDKLEEGQAKQDLLTDLGIAGDLISQANGLLDGGEYSQALEKLQDAGALLDDVEQGLKAQRQAEKGKG